MFDGYQLLQRRRFFTWVMVVLIGNLSLFQLYDAAGSSKALPWATVVAGVRCRRRLRSSQPTIGLHPWPLRRPCGRRPRPYALIDLSHDLSDANGLAAVGIGPYVGVAGCVAMVFGAVMLRPRMGTRKP